MLNYIPKNWGWYVAAGILFGPYILIGLMEDKILAHVIGLGFIPLGVLPVLLWAILSKEYDWLQPTDWFKKRINNISKEKLFIIGKLFLLGILLWVIPLSMNYLEDVVVYRQNEVPSVVATIINANTGTGALSLTLFLDGEPNRLKASYFPRNTFEEGYTYEFWYLPNTHEIIKVELISTNEPQ